jgi:hypothetical protein
MAALELACGQCGHWLMRWETDPDRPFEKMGTGTAVPGGAVSLEALGGYRRATDGKWYRWAPGSAADLPEGETRDRYVFTCPNGCRTSPQALVDKLEDAAETVLRALHETGTPLLRTTVDKLLEFRRT